MTNTDNNSDSSGSVPHRRGFTLVEMMFVIAIIAVLMAVAIPNYKRARTNSRINAATGHLELIANAVRQLRWDTGRWPNGALLDTPGSTEMWTMTGSAAGLLSYSSTYGSGWKGPYLRNIPLDPWGQPYFFDPDYLIGGENKIVVGSFGPNRVGQNVYDSDDVRIIMN